MRRLVLGCLCCILGCQASHPPARPPIEPYVALPVRASVPEEVGKIRGHGDGPADDFDGVRPASHYSAVLPAWGTDVDPSEPKEGTMQSGRPLAEELELGIVHRDAVVLTAEECLQRAHAASPLSSLVFYEKQVAQQSGSTHTVLSGRSANPTHLRLLDLRLQQQRNTTGALALTGFYNLADLDVSVSGLDRVLEELATIEEQMGRVREQGLEAASDELDPEKRSWELRRQREQLLGTRAELVAQLRVLLGIDPCGPWCDADDVVPDTRDDGEPYMPDCERAVERGVMCRAELGGLRLLLGGDSDPTSLKLVHSTLQQRDASLGQSVDAGSLLDRWLHGRVSDAERELRRRQLRVLLSETCNAIGHDIVGKLGQVEHKVADVELAERIWRRSERQLERLERQRELNRVGAAELAQARIDVVQAHTDHRRAVIALRLAEVRLLEAQGLLAGDTLPSVSRPPVAEPVDSGWLQRVAPEPNGVSGTSPSYERRSNSALRSSSSNDRLLLTTR